MTAVGSPRLINSLFSCIRFIEIVSSRTLRLPGETATRHLGRRLAHSINRCTVLSVPGSKSHPLRHVPLILNVLLAVLFSSIQNGIPIGVC